MSFSVFLTEAAQQDIQRLFDFVIERELSRASGRLEAAEEALEAIAAGLKRLERFPHTCRKADGDLALRELVISHGATGYVALFEITEPATMIVAAIRHQREDDYPST